MKLKTFYSNNKQGDTFIFEGQEFVHISKVFRLGLNDRFLNLSGDEYIYECEIFELNKNSLKAKVLSKKQNNANPKTNLSVFQCNLKADKIEYLLSKLNEIGVSELTLVNSQNTVKNSDLKQERAKTILIESCKQSGRSIPLKLNGVLQFKGIFEALAGFDTVLVAYEGEKNTTLKTFEKLCIKGKKVAIIIGSEGGFSETEIEELKQLKSVKVFGLGERILKAETACITIASIVLNWLGEYDE